MAMIKDIEIKLVTIEDSILLMRKELKMVESEWLILPQELINIYKGSLNAINLMQTLDRKARLLHLDFQRASALAKRNEIALQIGELYIEKKNYENFCNVCRNDLSKWSKKYNVKFIEDGTRTFAQRAKALEIAACYLNSCTRF